MIKKFIFLFLVLLNLTNSSDIESKNTPTIFTNYFDNNGTLYLNGNFTDQNGGIRLYYKYYDIYKIIDSNHYYYYSNSSNTKANSTIVIPYSANTIFKNNNYDQITIKLSYGNGSEIIPIESVYTIQSYFYNIELNQDTQIIKLQGFYFNSINNISISGGDSSNSSINNNSSIGINNNNNKTLESSINFKTNLNQTLKCEIKSISTIQPKTIECKLIVDNNQFNYLTSFHFIDYNNNTIDQDISSLKIQYPISNNNNKNQDSNSNNHQYNKKTQIPIPVDINKPSAINSNSNNFNQNNSNHMSSSKLLPIILIIPTVTLILMIFIVITIIKRVKDKKRIKQQEEGRMLNNIWYNVA